MLKYLLSVAVVMALSLTNPCFASNRENLNNDPELNNNQNHRVVPQNNVQNNNARVLNRFYRPYLLNNNDIQNLRTGDIFIHQGNRYILMGFVPLQEKL